MVAAFSKSTQVLYFHPSLGQQRFVKLKFLLWPVVALQVVACFPRIQQMNLFQKYCLELWKTGLCDPKAIGACLGLGAELIQYILQQLEQMGMLDHTQMPFSQQTNEVVSGYVFQDPFTGKFWPRFAAQLEFGDVEYDEKQRILLNAGTPNNPRKEKPFRLLMEQNSLVYIPNAEQIWQICCLHHQDWLLNQDQVIETEPILAGHTSNLEQISVLSAKPHPYLLVVPLLVLKNLDGKIGNWQMVDPFGLGPNPFFNELLAQRIREDESLSSILQEIPSEDSQPSHAESLWKAAKDLVEEKLGHDIIQSYPQLWENLSKMEMAYARLIPNGSKFLRQHEGIHAGVLACMDGLQLVHEMLGSKMCWIGQGLISQDRQNNAKLLEKIAVKLGFSSLPRCFQYVSLSQIQQAADTANAPSLAAAMVVALLICNRNPKHPFASIVSRCPELLNDLSAIIELDKKGHESVSKQSDIRSIVYKMIQNLLPLPA